MGAVGVYTRAMTDLTDAQSRACDVVTGIQGTICGGLEAIEARLGSDVRFRTDTWEREGGGGGTSRVLADGKFLEKGGVNVSVVHGALSEAFAARLPGDGTSFFATGVSLVLHPQSPHVPTVHANFRYIEHGDRAWFGGGADLTPYYFDPQDKAHFHRVWQELCEGHPKVADHDAFRERCDRYFYLSHRKERRGIGGIFFDYLHVGEAGTFDELLSFIQDGGLRFLDAYLPIVERHLDTLVTPAQREWQQIRRGRYVEFNLLYDRGTTFGLRTGGRTESILMSLPPTTRWVYDHEPADGTPEAALLQELRRPPPQGPLGPDA